MVRWWLAIAVVAILCALGFMLGKHWPFSQDEVLQRLQEAVDSQITVRAFHKTYFPFPGCVLEGLVLRHSSAPKPLVTIERLSVQGSYVGMLAHRVSRVIAEGMRIAIPPFGTGAAFHAQPSNIKIGELVANGMQIEFDSSDAEKEPLVFDVHEATFWNLANNRALDYRVKIHNPEPPGEVAASGKFGAWNWSAAGETPLSGEYTFEQADLSVFEGIAGKLSSQGKFSGKLNHIDISGSTETPDFEVKSSSHPILLRAQFDAYVDGTHGDTFLKHVDANFWNTHLEADGSIARSPNGKGKTALINLHSTQARIEDLLLMFVSSRKAPMSGSVTFRARAEIPPGREEFLKKVKLQGEFGIGGGSFTKKTQEGVDKFSAGARGEKDISDPGNVVTDLSGEEDLAKGIVTLTNLSFYVPGAHSRLHGTYNLINERIDLRGQLRVDTQISNTESGFKSALLKVIQPFFKRKPQGQIVPVRISGTYEHPTFGLDLSDKKAKHPKWVPGSMFSKQSSTSK